MVSAGQMALVILALMSSQALLADTFNDLQPVDPQPATGALEPGLAVNYVFLMAHHVDEIEANGPGESGKPLPKLDYRSGSGKVLSSDRADGVGALIKGFIKFPKTGRWLVATQSNDGVRVRIAGQVVVEDPDVHPDQYSQNAEINVTQPGWYELAVTYFERKNTSTLRLFWQAPDRSEFEVVPIDALAHLK